MYSKNRILTPLSRELPFRRQAIIRNRIEPYTPSFPYPIPPTHPQIPLLTADWYDLRHCELALGIKHTTPRSQAHFNKS
jgi:hypothetical protein